MTVFLFLKDNVKPKMCDIKWNAECHFGPILQNYYTIEKTKSKTNDSSKEERYGTFYVMFVLKFANGLSTFLLPWKCSQSKLSSVNSREDAFTFLLRWLYPHILFINSLQKRNNMTHELGAPSLVSTYSDFVAADLGLTFKRR
jgi:hypothetical protein